MPSWVVVPCVLDELEKAGVEDKDVTVVFGLGSHRKQTEEEMKRLVGEDVYNRVKCIDSDPDDVDTWDTARTELRSISSGQSLMQTAASFLAMSNTITLRATAVA